MNHKFIGTMMSTAVKLLLLLGSCASAFAQLSPAGTYLGRLGTNDIVVGIARRDLLAFYHLDRTNRRTELGLGTISAEGRSLITLNTGRFVNLTLSGNTVTGTLAGTSFAASLQSALGPFASKAYGYSGTMSNPVTDLNTLSFVILPDGRAALISSNPVEGIHGGIGTINAAGAVVVSMTNGDTWRMTFAPLEGVFTGLISSNTFSGRQSVLSQIQRSPIINVATRGTVGGGSVLTAGFVTTTSGKVLLIRAVGPTLGTFGVAGAQTDPVLTLFSGSSAIASNDNWSTAANATDIPAASLQAGAFALPAGSRDAVLLVTLEPGAYTAQVTGVGPAGDALVEVYEIR